MRSKAIPIVKKVTIEDRCLVLDLGFLATALFLLSIRYRLVNPCSKVKRQVVAAYGLWGIRG